MTTEKAALKSTRKEIQHGRLSFAISSQHNGKKCRIVDGCSMMDVARFVTVPGVTSNLRPIRPTRDRPSYLDPIELPRQS
jgi:hypothetical protein